MSEKRYVVPDGMLKSAWHEVAVKMSERIAVGDNSGVAELHVARIAIEAAIRWLDERDLTDDEVSLIVGGTEWSGYFTTIRTAIRAYFKHMFLAPEPEVPEAVKDLLCDRVRGGRGVYTHEDACNYVDGRIIEAYRRGMAQNP